MELQAERLLYLKFKGAINQAVLCLRTESDVILKLFLGVKKREFYQHIYKRGQGNLSAEIVKSIKLNLLPEQRKIADFLSAVDKKIRLLTEKKSNGSKPTKKG